jgi:hypothetical protein
LRERPKEASEEGLVDTDPVDRPASGRSDYCFLADSEGQRLWIE